MQKFLFRIHFGQKNFTCGLIFKIFVDPIRTELAQATDKKIVLLTCPTDKNSSENSLSDVRFYAMSDFMQCQILCSSIQFETFFDKLQCCMFFEVCYTK